MYIRTEKHVQSIRTTEDPKSFADMTTGAETVQPETDEVREEEPTKRQRRRRRGRRGWIMKSFEKINGKM